MNQKKQIIASLVFALALFAGSVWATIGVNKQGSSSVAVSVGTATPVAVFVSNANRINWTLYTDGFMYCMPGTYSGQIGYAGSGTFTAPSPAPSAGATPGTGFPFIASTYITERQLMLQAYMNGPQAASEDEAKVELDCVCQTGTCHVYTWEETTK